MIRIRRFSNQRGVTLAELLVAAAVIALIMAGVFLIQREGQEAYLLGSNRVETQQNARVALDLMTRELRTATSVTQITSATDMTFVDQNGKTRQYVLDTASSTLKRTDDDGVLRPLIGGIQSLTMTGYSVYDVYSNTYTTTTCGTIPNPPTCPNTALVRVTTISLVTKTEDNAAPGSPGDQHATMESTIRLRATLS